MLGRDVARRFEQSDAAAQRVKHQPDRDAQYGERAADEHEAELLAGHGRAVFAKSAVALAKAGVQGERTSSGPWAPAFAGMTGTRFCETFIV